MTEVPKFVGITREYISKDGLATDHPSRIKSRIRKALIKAGYHLQTIRGIGQAIDDYAIVYEEKEGKLFATFQPYSSLDLKPKKTRKAKGKGKSSLITGTHPSVADFTQEQFATEIIQTFPETWQRQPPESYRWLSIDVGLLLNTQHTIESAVNHFIHMAKETLPNVNPVSFTLIEIDDNFIIGIGPI